MGLVANNFNCLIHHCLPYKMFYLLLYCLDIIAGVYFIVDYSLFLYGPRV